MNDALIVSNVLLWILVLALGVVVVALTRQIGLLHERIAPLGALAVQQGPAVGEPAPRFDLPALSGRPVSIGAGERTLLFFLSPTCPVCETLLPTLRRVVADESVRLVLASDGDGEEHVNYVRSHDLEDVDYLLSMDLGSRLRGCQAADCGADRRRGNRSREGDREHARAPREPVQRR